jgi:hypothetical protein
VTDPVSKILDSDALSHETEECGRKKKKKIAVRFDNNIPIGPVKRNIGHPVSKSKFRP